MKIVYLASAKHYNRLLAAHVREFHGGKLVEFQRDLIRSWHADETICPTCDVMWTGEPGGVLRASRIAAGLCQYCGNAAARVYCNECGEMS